MAKRFINPNLKNKHGLTFKQTYAYQMSRKWANKIAKNRRK